MKTPAFADLSAFPMLPTLGAFAAAVGLAVASPCSRLSAI